MRGPARLIRSGKVPGLENRGAVYEWEQGSAYLMVDRVRFEGRPGAVLCYCNPPVHQVGNPGLDACLEGLERVSEERGTFEFLLLCGANDPVHAGGDLKESLTNLDRTLETRRELESRAAAAEEIDRLYDWADRRLEKGRALHGSLRRLAGRMRLVAACGGGTRYGGSAEIPLMADYLVGDSRSGMCFSEAMIGLIPGWAGVARAVIKAGPQNAACMAGTCAEVKAPRLQEIGIYNTVVEVPLAFPRRSRSADPRADQAAYAEALERHDEETGLLLLPAALRLAACPAEEIPRVPSGQIPALAPPERISAEVERRRNPQNYADLWGRPLKDLRAEIAERGRPLAPQSVEALEKLLAAYDPEGFNELAFVRQEMEADARLYRDPRLRAGLTATLEQTVADYRLQADSPAA